MATSIVNVKVDTVTKKEAQRVAEELGFSLGSLLRAYMKELIKTKRVEFDLDEEPNEYLKQRMKEAEENYKKGNTSPAFKTAKEAIDWLEKHGIG